MNCKPGISDSCLQILKRKVEEKKAAGSELCIAVLFDEMHIRKLFQWCNSSKTILGYPTYGSKSGQGDKNEDQAATQVIVFMASGINERLQLPFAYHFIKSLNAEERRDLLTDLLTALIDIGVKVTNVAFDGLIVNRKMCKLLGANLNIFSPSFIINGHRIYIILDIPHMEKLIRNALGKLKLFYDGSGKIEWRYYEQLMNYDKRGYALTHKLTQNHINFEKRKMKVDLAVQLFSGSTADSIEFLMKQGYKDFKDADKTISLTRLFDKLFDIFNSKTEDHAKRYKRSICPETEEEIFLFFEIAIETIKNLTFRAETGEVKKTR